MAIKMNTASGRALYDLCMPLLESFMMDIGDFIEEIGLPPYLLDQYFAGARDLPDDHLYRISRACGFDAEALAEYLDLKYRRGIPSP